jgi:hypothetical protein
VSEGDLLGALRSGVGYIWKTYVTCVRFSPAGGVVWEHAEHMAAMLPATPPRVGLAIASWVGTVQCRKFSTLLRSRRLPMGVFLSRHGSLPMTKPASLWPFFTKSVLYNYL